jgi:hypothetical protein
MFPDVPVQHMTIFYNYRERFRVIGSIKNRKKITRKIFTAGNDKRLALECRNLQENLWSYNKWARL